MAPTLINFSQLSKTWKIAIGGVLTLLATGGVVLTVRTQNSSGVTTIQEYSDGRRSQSGTLTVGSGSLKNKLYNNGLVMLNGLDYRFPYTHGSSSGKVLKTDGAGNLSWSTDLNTGGGGTGNFGTGNVLTILQATDNATSTGHLINTFKNIFLASSTGSLKSHLYTLNEARYVNTAGDTMTGKLLINLTSGTDALEVIQTISGSTVTAVGGQFLLQRVSGLPNFRMKDYTGSDRVNIGLSAPGVVMQMYDEDTDLLVDWNIDNGGNFTFYDPTGTRAVLYGDLAAERIGIGTNTPDTKLDVLGTISGSALTVTGLKNCDSIDTNSAGALSCGTDATGGSGAPEVGTASFSGAVRIVGDTRYVKKQGDTMTGTLNIAVTGGTNNTVALELPHTASGRILHAQDLLRSSGALVVEGVSNLTGNISAGALLSFVGYSASPQITAADSTTGLHFDGPGILSFHNGGVQTVLLSSSNKVGIRTGAPGSDLSVSGSVIINPTKVGSVTADTSLALEIIGTASGKQLHAQDVLRSSGALAVQGAVTFKGLVSCTALQTSSAGALSCNNAVYLATSTGSLETRFNGLYFRSSTGALQTRFDGIYNPRFVNISGDTMTGALNIAVTGGSNNTVALELPHTASGRIVHAQDLLRSSGALAVEGDVKFNNGDFWWDDAAVALGIGGQPSGTYALELISAGLLVSGGGVEFSGGNFLLSGGEGRLYGGNVVIGANATPKAKLEVFGTVSGSALSITGLKSCDTIDTNAAGAFVCGTDSVGAGSFDQASTDKRYVNQSGDTMTGGLLIQNGGTAGTIKAGYLLEIKGAMSGASLNVANSLASSGTLVVTGTATVGDLSCVDCLDYTEIADGPALDASTTTTLGNFFYTLNLNGNGDFLIQDAGNTIISVTDLGLVTFNADQGDRDLNIKGDTDASLFYADASTDRVGIGTATPDTKVEVIGTLSGSSVVSLTALSPANGGKQLFASGSTVGTGTGKGLFTIPRSMTGFILTDMICSVDTAGTTNATAIDLKNITKGRNFFTKSIEIDSAELTSLSADTAFSINAANDDVGGGDRIQFNIPRVSTTAPKGLHCTYTFRKP